MNKLDKVCSQLGAIMTYNLAELATKQRAKVLSLGGSRNVFRKKLLSMGLTPGIEVNILRKAPLGGPIELSLRGFSLSLRQNEAQNIMVQPV